MWFNGYTMIFRYSVTFISGGSEIGKPLSMGEPLPILIHLQGLKFS